jgi:hypothetical protein
LDLVAGRLMLASLAGNASTFVIERFSFLPLSS